MMTFGDSIKTVYGKYAEFSGRASRSEYWWFTLFTVLAGLACAVFSDELAILFWIGNILPGLAVLVRRLHDTGRSGWWCLLSFIPILNLVCLVMLCLASVPGANEYGACSSEASAGSLKNKLLVQ